MIDAKFIPDPPAPGVEVVNQLRFGNRTIRRKVVMLVSIGYEYAEMDVLSFCKWAHSQRYIAGYNIQAPQCAYVLLTFPDTDGENATYQQRLFTDWVYDAVATEYFQASPGCFNFLTEETGDDEE